MIELDYYMVMEKSILFYRKKYDPENRLEIIKNAIIKETPCELKKGSVKNRKPELAKMFSFLYFWY